MINKIHFGDCRASLRTMAAAGVRVQTCVTSPPYFGLRDYGHAGQIGLEETPEQFIAELVEVFRCVRDVLADDGTLWVNIGDSYARQGGRESTQTRHWDGREKTAGSLHGTRLAVDIGLKPKDMIGIPWMLAFALRADGWYLRQDIIWHKPNPMPEAVKDRCIKAHEYIFLLSKSEKYLVAPGSLKEPSVDGGSRARHSVWRVNARGYKGAHLAVFPTALVEPCILAGSRQGDIVLDPFMGSGTTAAVAIRHGRQFIGCELNPEYKALQDERIDKAYAELLKDLL